MTKEKLSPPLTLRIPLDLLGNAEKIAAASERTRSWVIVRALKKYIETGEGSEILAVVEGRAQIAAGDTHDMDDVIQEIQAIVSTSDK
jgi:predicted transcriptional regulator